MHVVRYNRLFSYSWLEAGFLPSAPFPYFSLVIHVVGVIPLVCIIQVLVIIPVFRLALDGFTFLVLALFALFYVTPFGRSNLAFLVSGSYLVLDIPVALLRPLVAGMQVPGSLFP